MKNILFKRVSPNDKNVQELIRKLNDYQISLYGLEQCNLESPDEMIKNKAYVIGACLDNTLIGIGSVKLVNDYAEIKRMYVEKHCRGMGIAHRIIEHLEKHVEKQRIERICLETGNKHTAAMKFYKRLGYYEIEKFGNYQPNDVSVYFEKIIL